MQSYGIDPFVTKNFPYLGSVLFLALHSLTLIELIPLLQGTAPRVLSFTSCLPFFDINTTRAAFLWLVFT